MNELLVFFSSLIVAAVVTPLVIMIYKYKKWLDDPDKNQHVKTLHTSPVPRGGGIAIFAAISLCAVFFVPFTIYLIPLLIASGILMITGVIDDVKDLNPYLRFGICLLVGIIVVLSGIKLEYITHPFEPGVLYIDHPSFILNDQRVSLSLPYFSVVVTLLWIVWNMNVINWSKGVDGQLPGQVMIAAFFLGLLSMRFVNDPNQTPVILLSFIVAGAFGGLLLWNVYPQKIMPGYGAGSLAGFWLAVIAILSGSKLATAILVIALPTADAMFTISRRLLRKKSPFWGDRGHLHHKLIDVLGWSKTQTAFFYWITTFIMGIIALQLKSEQKVFTIGVVITLVFAFLIWAKIFITFLKPPARDNG